MRHRLLFKAIVLYVIFFNCSTISTREIVIYVSPSGNDTWSGRLANPNVDRTDGPLASLEKARDVIRTIKKDAGPNVPKIVVYLRSGNYPLSRSFQLTHEDGGTDRAPVIWRNYPNDSAVITGVRTLTRFEPITDPDIRNRIDPNYRAHIRQLDLPSQGITDFGEITPRGTPGLELFCGGQRMTPARFPNDGWLLIADVPQTGGQPVNQGLEREKRYDGVPVGRHYGRIKYDGDRPRRWHPSNEIYLHGYWTWDWSDSYQKVQAIDPTTHEITLAEPHHHYGYTKNQRFYYLNILEELDQPGEWVLDRHLGRIYFWPPAATDSSSILVSMLSEPLLSLENCEHVTIQGLQFRYSRGSGVVVNRGRGNRIAGCIFAQLGNQAVVINGGYDNGVTGCDIADVALGGITLRGGDRQKLIPAHNFATNNHIHHWSQWLRTGQLAIDIFGVGQLVAHNRLHDAPHGAIYVRGNEHLLEYNEIYNVCYETGDAGAIHTGRNYTWRGNCYRFNYIHHLKGPGLHGVTALYLDDFTSGFILYGNICYRSGRGVLIGGGRDNRIENNIFIECTPAIVLDARGLGWASNYFDGSYTVLQDSLEAMNFRQPPYSDQYPELLTLYEDEPDVPKNNQILRNISYGGRWIELYDFFEYDFSVITIKDNIIADSIICKRIKAKPAGWEPYYLNLDTADDYNFYRRDDPLVSDLFAGNVLLSGDPGFVNFQQQNFDLKKDSPAYQHGFQPLPLEKIGLITDEYRKQLPPRD